MAVVVPGRGWCCFIRGVPETEYYGLLGPFAEGSFLRRLLFQVGGQAAFTARVGAVVGPSGEATEVAFRAGKTLIERSTESAFGVTLVDIDVVAGVSERILLAPGVRIHSGARYCVVHFYGTAGPTRIGLAVTAEVLESKKGD